MNKVTDRWDRCDRLPGSCLCDLAERDRLTEGGE